MNQNLLYQIGLAIQKHIDNKDRHLQKYKSKV